MFIQSILNDLKIIPIKVWEDESWELYNNPFKKWLKYNYVAMCSTYKEPNSVVAGRFIRTLENKTFHRTIKIKPIDNKSTFYAESNIDSNAKDPEFKLPNHVRI